jgi:hypothetical protein
MKMHKQTDSSIMKKIPKPQKNFSIVGKPIPILHEDIENLRKRRSEKLLFSFRFVDRNHEAFNLGGICESWFISLLDGLKEVSDLTWTQLVMDLKDHYRSHLHDWDTTSYKYNFDDEFLEQVECRQFSLSAGTGRVHGFIVGNRFYIVWLDPHHNLYPSDNHGGLRLFPPPDKCRKDCKEWLREENERLRKENEELISLMEIKTRPG